MAGESALRDLAVRIADFVVPLWSWGAGNALPIALVMASALAAVFLYLVFFDPRRLK